MSQRLVQSSMRRLVATNRSFAVGGKSLRFASPSAVAFGQIRPATSTPSTQSQIISQAQGYDILAAQRLQRPISPHLTIYQPQITWYGSISHRLTGAILSGGFYIFGFGYLVAPYIGLHWESASLAAWFAGLSVAAKIAIKSGLALPFTYHSINGIRHLVWDTGAAFTNKQVIVTGYTALALSVVSAVYLTFY